MSETREAKPEGEPRQPYEKPAVTTEEVFETLALVCCKVATGCQPTPGTGQSLAS